MLYILQVEIITNPVKPQTGPPSRLAGAELLEEQIQLKSGSCPLGDAGNLDTAWSDQRREALGSNERIFDVIVIGSGIGGLAAAAALGKTGRQFPDSGALCFSSLVFVLTALSFSAHFQVAGRLARHL